MHEDLSPTKTKGPFTLRADTGVSARIRECPFHSNSLKTLTTFRLTPFRTAPLRILNGP